MKPPTHKYKSDFHTDAYSSATIQNDLVLTSDFCFK